jgi:Fe-S oxidoreductase
VRGKVILWDDTFVRYHEPNIGIAAVKVLEALGFGVELVQNRKCCGRPAFSQGILDAATEVGQHNVDLLNSSGDVPILFLEPSCWSMFVEDYQELKIPNAEKIAERCVLFEKFVDDLLEREPGALRFKERETKVAIHAHCHAKSLTKTEFMTRLVERIPNHKATLLETGCCGMAGAFGALAEKYELSKQVFSSDLQRKIDHAQPDVVIASGTSCRHQIVDLSERWPKHMAELLADAIK